MQYVKRALEQRLNEINLFKPGAERGLRESLREVDRYNELIAELEAEKAQIEAAIAGLEESK